ncbi:GNAT family N-acetyltransferase [Halomicroarcula sp. GCM10025324]|jgi:ribosomal protein S18 acetylase RimI-like enzyme|uniref:GNAT family N-acetyltransferase n=1 Tax=Haloarcula TaxID=2237 RepID=UPI0023E8B17F|nr:GNAT family N-acetyltransferase [Halomicroarcula sp. ZS-22-S1]
MESSAGEVTEFPRPPQTFTDRAGEEIRITAYDGGPDPLAAMYLDYDDASRAQGLPPRGEAQIREWLDDLLEAGLSVAAWHDDRVVGHAVLFPYDDTAELAIFVHPEYQTIGIGSRLIRILLGYGQANDLDHVWLAVERTNLVAMNLYKSVGFETTVRDRAEHEMELTL